MPFNFKTYMLNVATRLKDIGHTEEKKRFFETSNISTLDGLFANLNQAHETILIAQVNPEGSIGDPNKSNNYRDEGYFVFYVAKHESEFNSASLVNAAKEHCKNVGFKIFAKMRRDKATLNSDLRFLQFTRVPYQAIGPFANGWYGVMFSFRVDENASALNYNENDWLDE